MIADVIWALAGLVLAAGMAIALIISARQGRFNVTGNVDVSVSLSLPAAGGGGSGQPKAVHPPGAAAGG